MEDHWEDRCVITGVGISDIGRKTGTPGLKLAAIAARQAMADAGLLPTDIDGITSVGEAPVDLVAEAVGLRPSWTGEGGSSVGGSIAGVHNACRAVASGLARHVLVYRNVGMLGGSALPSGSNSEQHRAPGPAYEGSEWADVSELLTYDAFSSANWIAMHARRHMYLYGTTREQLGWIAINARRNAALNPRAVYRDPITMEDYLSARWISEPLGLLDCDVPVDGACAFVVSHAGYAPDCPNGAVRVQAAARVSGRGGWFRRPDYPNMASVDAAAEMWNRTDLRPADIDFAQLYDGFTFLTLAWLEALGFCGRGESGPFVDDGTRIARDGQLPLNTYGGQLSAGRMHGHWVLHEACTQLRGGAGERQLPRHDVAVFSTGGGPLASCMVLTR